MLLLSCLSVFMETEIVYPGARLWWHMGRRTPTTKCGYGVHWNSQFTWTYTWTMISSNLVTMSVIIYQNSMPCAHTSSYQTHPQQRNWTDITNHFWMSPVIRYKQPRLYNNVNRDPCNKGCLYKQSNNALSLSLFHTHTHKLGVVSSGYLPITGICKHNSLERWRYVLPKIYTLTCKKQESTVSSWFHRVICTKHTAKTTHLLIISSQLPSFSPGSMFFSCEVGCLI